MRSYRIGDLPDVQISNKDIIDPLKVLCELNEEICSEIFIAITKSIYLESSQADGKNLKIHEFIDKILRETKILNYQIVQCIHTFILNIMKKSEDYFPDLNLIASSGLYSKNIQSAILIFEEYLINQENSKGNEGVDDVMLK